MRKFFAIEFYDYMILQYVYFVNRSFANINIFLLVDIFCICGTIKP